MIKPYYQKDGITIYNADCREVLPQLGAVDVVLTSPPYGNQRKYEIESLDWNNLVPPSLSSVVHNDKTQQIINLGQFIEDGEVSLYWLYLVEQMKKTGWKFAGFYIWDQGSGLPGDWNGRLAPSHEYILHFWRDRKEINKIEKCTSWKPGRKVGEPGMRSKDGKTSPHTDRMRQPTRVPDSVLRIPRANQTDVKESFGHPAIYPVRLARYLCTAFSNPTETILDPFMGSGTTLVAAKLEGRQAVGIEINEKYCEAAVNRLAQGVLF